MLSSVIILTDVALRTDRPLVYIVFPTLIWAALRFGPRGGTLAVAVAVGFTLWKTAHHSGPFVVESIPRSTLSTQLYVSVAALSTMFLAAVVAERQAIAKGLLESRARLIGGGGPRAAPAGEQPARRRSAHADDARRPARDGQRIRRNPDLEPGLFEDAETHLLIAIDELRDLAQGSTRRSYRPRPRRGDPQPDRGSPVPIRLLELPRAGSTRRPRRLPTTSSPRPHERAAPRPREDDHDPRDRVGALSATT